MEQLSAAAVATLSRRRKSVARVALVDLKEPERHVLADCFRQIGLEVVVVGDNGPQLLQLEKFEACVVKLSPEYEAVMQSARTSPSNHRMVIYGLGGSAQDAMQFSRFGVNAIFKMPLDRPAALKLVRATQMLIVHEFRRYVRIPVITEISVLGADGRRFNATSREISSGGLSMTCPEDLIIGAQMEISFALLTLPRIWVRAHVSWKKSKAIGVRFDLTDDRRARIKSWIDGYLEA